MAKKRGRPAKAEQAKARGRDLIEQHDNPTLTDTVSSNLEDREPHGQQDEPRKKKISHKHRAKKATVEDVEEEMEYLQFATKPNSKPAEQEHKIVKGKKVEQSAIVAKLLEDLHAISSSLSSSPAEANSWLEECGFTSNDIRTLDEQCRNIGLLLRNSQKHRTPNVRSRQTAPDGDGEFIIYRPKSTQLQFLYPYVVFQGRPGCQFTNKGFGFIRRSGEQVPLMFAISGSKDVALDDDELLSNSYWQTQVFNMYDMAAKTFKTNGWEAGRGARTGTDISSHAELKLMLWAACMELRDRGEKYAVAGKNKDRPIAFIALLELRDMPNLPTFEIVLHKLPCTSCKQFHAWFEKKTGLKFVFTVAKNVGDLSHEPNKHLQRTFSRFGTISPGDGETDEDLEEQEEAEEDEEIQEASTSKFAFKDFVHHPMIAKYSQNVERAKRQTTTVSTTTVARYRTGYDNLYDEEWIPSTPAKPRSQKKASAIVSQCAPPTPSSGFFVAEAYEHAEKIKAKYKGKRGRESYNDESPLKLKAARHRK